MIAIYLYPILLITCSWVLSQKNLPVLQLFTRIRKISLPSKIYVRRTKILESLNV